VARWRPVERARIEPPLWYRVFDPAAWDEPDGQERRMLAGCLEALGAEWVAGRHRMHAHRRWAEAKWAYQREHPALAEQELTDIVTRNREWQARVGSMLLL
jgi:hypothetical protein